MAFLALTTLVLATTGTARADCPDPGAAVERVEQAVLDARFEDARAAMALVEAAFGCTGTADSTLLARIWLAEGAMAHIEGDLTSRNRAFASAARVAPEVWTRAFGEELHAAWQAAAQEETGIGLLTLEGLAEDAVALVDGQPVSVPAQLASGLYLVQADADGGPPVFARIVLVPDDQNLVLQVDDPSLHTAATTVDQPRRKKWPWLAAAGGAALLSGTSAVLAVTQDGALDQAGTTGDLDAAHARQQAFAYGSYGLAGASAVLLGIGLVW